VSILEESHRTLPHCTERRRMVCVTRRFWPHVDDACLRLLAMFDGLTERGIQPHVLTARWHASWPERAVLRDASVVRLLPPPSSHWNEGHFQKNVVTWLARNVEAYDCIYVDRADGLLSAIVSKSAKWRKPVVARFALEHAPGEMAKAHHQTSVATVNALRRCQCIVTPSSAAHRYLLAQGIDAKRIERIPDTVERSADRSHDARREASASLFQVSSDFVIPGRTDLILHVGLAEPNALWIAVSAVCDLLDAGVSVRMWVIGSGTEQDRIHQGIKDRGWHREILLFDGFDDLEELVAVADLALVSNPEVALQYSALMFLNSNVPMILADTLETRSRWPELQLLKLYRDREELVARLRDWQIHRQQWNTEAIALRHQVERQLPGIDSMNLWEKIVKSLAIGIQG
jgi:glycosyltransferase involved in cell wall biosynthesis